MKRFALLLMVTLLIGSISGMTNLISAKGPKKVELKKEGERWQMYVDGEPFFMKGASVYPVPPQNQTFYTTIANYGANTVRTFRTYVDSREILDNCERLGLMVHVGLQFRSIRSGYYDKDVDAALAKQEEEILTVVNEFKNHPAVLCWSIGNEIDVTFHKDTLIYKYYESIERIARKIHEIDPNHPVTNAVLNNYSKERKHALQNICKSLDFFSYNIYRKADNKILIPDMLDAYEWEKAFVTTELGQEGYWHREKLGNRRYTDWNAVLDHTSTEKEAIYDACITKAEADPRCVGVLSFLWGNETQTIALVKEWHSLLALNGYTYGAVDILQKHWTGHMPLARAPRIESKDDIKMNGKLATDWIRVSPGSENVGTVKVGNPAKVKLRYHWRIIAEGSSRHDFRFADGIEGLIADNGNKKIHFAAPYTPGAYRLYVHVYDDVNRKAAYASIPFLVE